VTTTATPATGVAAVVAGHEITAAEVDRRLAALRAGAFGSRLAGPNTAEGRNARRWVLQLLCAEWLVRRELQARGVVVSGRRQPLSLPRALALGGVAAAVLAAVPEIGELRFEAAAVGPDAVLDYYRRNPDLFADRGVAEADAAPLIRRELERAAADQGFGTWLERRLATEVVLAPGFEHPAEPGHPDSTHRH